MTLRLLPYAVADGPHNMALDEALLHSAATDGKATLRFYGWSEATVSLGYFQPERVRHDEPGLAELPWVRRPSGGDSLVHHHEVTYALTLPPGSPWQPERAASGWMTRMHAIIAAALTDVDIKAIAYVSASRQQFSGPLCYLHLARGDLILNDRKIVGSAQRRHRGALLQHGAILLAQSPYTPELPGILELTGKRLNVEEVCAAVLGTFQDQTGWMLDPESMTEEEEVKRAELVTNKYTADSWNRKR